MWILRRYGDRKRLLPLSPSSPSSFTREANVTMKVRRGWALSSRRVIVTSPVAVSPAHFQKPTGVLRRG